MPKPPRYRVFSPPEDRSRLERTVQTSAGVPVVPSASIAAATPAPYSGTQEVQLAMWRSMVSLEAPLIARAVLSNRVCCWGGGHQPEECAGLAEVVVVVTGVEPVGVIADLQRGFPELRPLLPPAVAVRVDRRRRPVVAVDAHLPVAVDRVDRAPGRIHRDRMVVDADAVALGVPVGEQATLQHCGLGRSRSPARRWRG